MHIGYAAKRREEELSAIVDALVILEDYCVFATKRYNIELHFDYVDDEFPLEEQDIPYEVLEFIEEPPAEIADWQEICRPRILDYPEYF